MKKNFGTKITDFGIKITDMDVAELDAMIAAQLETMNYNQMTADQKASLVDQKTPLMEFVKFAESVRVAKLRAMHAEESANILISLTESMHAEEMADIPLKNADLLIYWFLPSDDWDEVLGDLTEGYYKVLKLSSPSAAKWWYWCQTFRSIGYFIVCRVYNAFEKVRKLFSMR